MQTVGRGEFFKSSPMFTYRVCVIVSRMLWNAVWVNSDDTADNVPLAQDRAGGHRLQSEAIALAYPSWVAGRRRGNKCKLMSVPDSLIQTSRLIITDKPKPETER